MTRADDVHSALRAALLAGAFPYGQRLVEEQLAERFHTSRTPVREALRRLEGDGHVVRDRSGGVRPNAPRVSAMRELYAVRTVLEDLAVRTADPAQLDAAATRNGSSCAPSATSRRTSCYADEAFHEAIAHASGNSATERYLHDINERIRVIRIHDFTTVDRIVTTIEEHLEILDALRAGRPDAAAALMRVHIERVGGSGRAPGGGAARAHVRGGATMSSVATNAFAAARERLAAQVIDPPEKRPAYEVFGPPVAPLPALGGLPRTGQIAEAAAALDAGAITSVELTEEALARIAQDEWTAFVHVDAEARAGRGARPGRRAARRPARGPLHGMPGVASRTSSTSAGCRRAAARTPSTRCREVDAAGVGPLARGRRRDPRQDEHARVRARA